MLKKKISISLICAFVASFAAAVFSFGGITAKAEEIEVYPGIITTVTVAAYGDAFSYSDDEHTVLSGFELPQGIDGYFKVVIPDTVTSIAGTAFVAGPENTLAEKLLGVTIPSGVAQTAVAAGAFNGCNALAEVIWEGGAENAVAATGLAGVHSFITASGAKATLGLTADEYLVVHDTRGATRNPASTLWSVIAYGGELTELTLPAPSDINPYCAAYSINHHAFAKSKLTSVALPAGVTNIGNNAFSESASLASVTLNEGLTSIGSAAFNGTAITSVAIPSTVTEIGSNAFNGCAELENIDFAERTEKLNIKFEAFRNCSSLRVVSLPDNCEVEQNAFEGCSSLIWAYVGENTEFTCVADDAVFFPANRSLTIVFPSYEEYDAAMSADDPTFSQSNGSSATYVVDVNFYIGGSGGELITYKRLHGRAFNFVYDEQTRFWNTETEITSLPAQAAHYASTVWYSDENYNTKYTLARVNELLADENTTDGIELFCHATVYEPVLPAEPVTWVYDKEISYDINDLGQVLKALGCTQEYTAEQLSVLRFTVVYADADSNVADKPEAISQNGVYNVSIILNPEFGEWLRPVTSTVTINANTSWFIIVLIIFLVLGAIVAIVTVTTAVIRKRVQERNKKKQLSKQEVLEKFRAAGGETDLK